MEVNRRNPKYFEIPLKSGSKILNEKNEKKNEDDNLVCRMDNTARLSSLGTARLSSLACEARLTKSVSRRLNF